MFPKNESDWTYDANVYYLGQRDDYIVHKRKVMGTDHGTSLGGVSADTTSERQYKYTIWVRNTALTTNIPMSDYTFMGGSRREFI